MPVRGCDVGGWTDTWFAGTGRVCSLALGPGVTVMAERAATRTTFELPDTGERFDAGRAPARHRLLVEALAEADVAAGVHLRVQVRASVPPATSLGTSAAVCVGVIAAVDVELRGAVRPAAELAAAAHRVEVVRLGRQSGVQDQLAAAHGGANHIDVDYPSATVEPVALDEAVRTALDDQLLHVAYGGAHDSSAVHEQVIAELEGEGRARPGSGGCAPWPTMRPTPWPPATCAPGARPSPGRPRPSARSTRTWSPPPPTSSSPRPERRARSGGR